MSKKKTSLADIANALGVSKSLVSMVLNGQGNKIGISTDTQERVMAKAKELNYQPNQVARGLRLGRSNTIGLIVADISNTFYAKISRAVEDYASAKGYHLMVCSTEEDADKELQLINMLRERQADGLIIASTLPESKVIQQMKQEGYPFVLIDRYFSRLNANAVVVDNEQGAEQAVSHLIELGHQNIAELTISPSHLSSIKERDKGYRNALKDHGIRFDKKLVKEISFHNLKEEVAAALEDLLSPPAKATALFVVNNNLAIACLEYINSKGLKIPDDVALISFDDLDIFKFCHPPITAVAQPVEDIGTKAVELLIGEIQAKESPAEKEQIMLPTELVIRASCGSKTHQKTN